MTGKEKILTQRENEDLKGVIESTFNDFFDGHGEFEKTYIDGMAKAAAIECGMAAALWAIKKFKR